MATVYKILSPCLKECYVGSTTMEVERRWWHHRSKSNETSSSILFEKYGDDCKFVVLEMCPLEDQFIKEQWWLDHSVGTVNKRNANRTKEDHKECNKKYYEANTDKIKAHTKEYYEANSDRIKARMKEYYEANIDRIKAYKKERYEARKALNQMGK